MTSLKSAASFALFGLALAGSPQAWSKTYYVSTAGNNKDGSSWTNAYTDIGSAVNAAALDYIDPQNLPLSGDTILVRSGTYNPFGIKIAATKDSPFVVKAETLSAKPVINFTGWNGVGIGQNASWITVQGFNIIGDAASIKKADALAVDKDPDHNPYYNGNCVGIKSNDPTLHPVHIQILDNILSYCPGAGVGAVQSDYITVSRNVVYATSFYSAYGTSGISLLTLYDSDGLAGRSNSTDAQKNFITENTVYGVEQLVPTKSSGRISDGQGIIIDTNENSAATSPGGVTLPAYPGVTVIENNVIYTNGGNGIVLYQSDHVLVDHNSAYGNAQNKEPDALAHGFGSAPEFAISYCKGDITVINNIFVSKNAKSPPVVVHVSPGTDYYFSRNVLWNSTLNNAASVEALENRTALGAVTLNSTNQYVDPRYVALPPQTGAVNLNVQANSPALNAGYNWLIPAVDITGAARKDGNSVGAYDNASY